MTVRPPTTDQAILHRAGRALGKIHAFGTVARLTPEDIEAMALALVILGLVTVPLGHPYPPHILKPQGNHR